MKLFYFKQLSSASKRVMFKSSRKDKLKHTYMRFKMFHDCLDIEQLRLTHFFKSHFSHFFFLQFLNLRKKFFHRFFFTAMHSPALVSNYHPSDSTRKFTTPTTSRNIGDNAKKKSFERLGKNCLLNSFLFLFLTHLQ